MKTTPIKTYRETMVYDVYNTLLEKGYAKAEDGTITLTTTDLNISILNDEGYGDFIEVSELTARYNSLSVVGVSELDTKKSIRFDWTEIPTDELYEVLEYVINL